MLTVEQKLERQIDELIKQNAALAAENETLSEKLAAMESQEPVASKELGRWAGLESLHSMPNGSRLYAAPLPAVAVPKNFQDAIAVLKENLRDKDRGVKACGIYDNDRVRDALNTILSDTYHSQQIPPSLAGFVLYLRERYRMLVGEQMDEYLNLSDRCPNHENTNQDTPKA